MFDVQLFVEDCQAVCGDANASRAIHEIVERAVSEPRAVFTGLGEPQRAGVHKIHEANDLSILNVVWGPHMTIMPHNHEMPAIIGVYSGGEDNIFWRRDDENPHLIRAAGARSLRERDVASLGPNAIHSVTNPVPRLTGAIHVYLGAFFTEPRSEWDPQTLIEDTYDVSKTMRLFEESNDRLAAG